MASGLVACSSPSSSPTPAATATSTTTAAAPAPSASNGLSEEAQARNRLILDELAGAKERALKDHERRAQLEKLMAKLPAKHSRERQELFIDAVRRGLHDPLSWTTIQTQYDGHEAAIRVTTDALKLNGVRIDVTAQGAQRIADLLGLWMPTPRLLQAIWERRRWTRP